MSPPYAVTVVAWIKTADASNTRALLYDRLETHDGFGLVLDSLGYPYLSINGGHKRIAASVNVYDQQWHFIVGTYSSVNEKMKIYVDGNLSDSTFYSDSIDYSPEPRNQIGRVKTGEDYFKGAIDEIRIYNRAITVEEVVTLYDNYTSVIDDNSFKTPTKFKLYQNYPNPFNSSTTIKF